MGRAGAEPFRIKVVEPVSVIAREQREEVLRESGYNLFRVPAEYVYIDLLTDSGTGAMSAHQWAGIMTGDESYAGCRNFYSLERSVRDIFNYQYVIPTHQGRAAERLLMLTSAREGQYVISNMLFDTTEAHVEHRGAIGVNIPIPEGLDTSSGHPFKGNIDLEKLEDILKKAPEKIAFILITVTCNNNGGQPVSMDNMRRTREIANRYGVPVFFDAARYAENALFIKRREPGYAAKSLRDIAREMFSYGDGCTMSAKKCGLVNIGGFLAFANEALYRKALPWLVLYEGYQTYGGLAGRDLEALARGLQEGIEEPYLEDRIGQVEYLGECLLRAEVPIVEPIGGHAVYIDARRMLPHIPPVRFPADALAVTLYHESGVRAVGLGALAFMKEDPETGEMRFPELELTRLAIPRRVYTDRHMDYVADSIVAIKEKAGEIRGLAMVSSPPFLRHFLSVLEPL